MHSALACSSTGQGSCHGDDTCESRHVLLSAVEAGCGQHEAGLDMHSALACSSTGQGSCHGDDTCESHVPYDAIHLAVMQRHILLMLAALQSACLVCQFPQHQTLPKHPDRVGSEMALKSQMP